jgi:hypothetical protein
LTRAWMTSSSKGRTCSRTCARAVGGAMLPRTPYRLVASAEAWLKRRSRAREERRRDQSYFQVVLWKGQSVSQSASGAGRGE